MKSLALCDLMLVLMAVQYVSCNIGRSGPHVDLVSSRRDGEPRNLELREVSPPCVGICKPPRVCNASAKIPQNRVL